MERKNILVSWEGLSNEKTRQTIQHVEIEIRNHLLISPGLFVIIDLDGLQDADANQDLVANIYYCQRDADAAAGHLVAYVANETQRFREKVMELNMSNFIRFEPPKRPKNNA